MKNKKAAGFIGWATYELKDEGSDWNKVTCMLARFAEYANVGGYRAGGFGVVRLASGPDRYCHIEFGYYKLDCNNRDCSDEACFVSLDPCVFCFFYGVVVRVVCEDVCLVGYGGCGYDAVAHGDVFVLTFD